MTTVAKVGLINTILRRGKKITHKKNGHHLLIVMFLRNYDILSSVEHRRYFENIGDTMEANGNKSATDIL